MIEALKATLAPFAKREKPQLSTWLAASFIKAARVLGVERVLRVARRTARSKLRTTVELADTRVSIGLSGRSGGSPALPPVAADRALYTME
jgi:hypothetical protein